MPGSTVVPANVVEGDDADAVVAQVNINQLRDRLSSIAEAEALVTEAGERSAAGA